MEEHWLRSITVHPAGRFLPPKPFVSLTPPLGIVRTGLVKLRTGDIMTSVSAPALEL